MEAYGSLRRPNPHHVRVPGNVFAQEFLERVFQSVSQVWRGLGSLCQSGLALRGLYQYLDVQSRFLRQLQVHMMTAQEDNRCISGLVLQGLKKPHDCPKFGNRCRPEHSLGVPMVSLEGACAAYYCVRRIMQGCTQA